MCKSLKNWVLWKLLQNNIDVFYATNALFAFLTDQLWANVNKSSNFFVYIKIENKGFKVLKAR